MISPTPLLMIVAEDDHLTPTDLALDAFDRAGEPKALEILPGGHFAPYTDLFGQSSRVAAEWFVERLGERRL
ncbi:hydrolase of the alpha/beta superfamily (plasmid) [Sinorhizobium americanum CCGM7]|nr:hydrolase of the alpha/beta superfamily [Sinorhizobium americanum CCGM7]